MAKGSMEIPSGVKSTIGWILGLGVAALILLIFLILFGNLSGNVGFGQESTAFTNETITLSDAGATPATADNRVNGNLTSVVMTNASGGEIINSANYTVSGVIITAATAGYNNSAVNVSATVTYDGQGLTDTNSLINNYSLAATNTSAQFPTVGTIIGIALLLLVLIAILIFAIRALTSLGGGGSSGMGAPRNSTFEGSTSSSFG